EHRLVVGEEDAAPRLVLADGDVTGRRRGTARLELAGGPLGHGQARRRRLVGTRLRRQPWNDGIPHTPQHTSLTSKPKTNNASLDGPTMNPWRVGRTSAILRVFRLWKRWGVRGEALGRLRPILLTPGRA